MQHFDRARQSLAIGLAGLAGYVDAMGFLSADGYFVSFMSGNTTRLAVDLAQDWRSAATPALLILGFICGVAGGAALGVWAGHRRKPAVLALVATLLIGAAAARGGGHHAVMMALLVMAMGAINNTFQRGGEVAVGLTYMTGALVKFGQGLGAALAGQARPGWGAYLLLWLGLTLGAVAGAMAFIHIGGAALWLAGGMACLGALAAIRLGEPAISA